MSGWDWFLRHRLFQRLDELLWIDGLGDVRVAASTDALLAVACHGVGGQGNYRPCVPGPSEHLRSGIAVHDGHLHIHEDQIERVSGLLCSQDKINRNLPIFGQFTSAPALRSKKAINR